MTTEAPPTEAMGAAMLDMLAVARHACGDAPRAKRVAGAALAAEGHDPALLLAAAGGLSWMAAARIGSDDWDGDAATADFVLGEARRGLIYGLQSGTSTRAEAEVGMAVLRLAQPGSSWAHLYDLARRRLGTHGLLDGSMSSRSRPSWSRS